MNSIRNLPNWVCWKKKDRDNGKIGKMPINPLTGQGAKANDSTTWTTYDKAMAAKEKNNYDGIGFEFTDSSIVGIDIDNCIENGQMNDMARTIVEALDTYTEISPSGTGLHILVRSDLQLEHGRKDDSIGLEVYTEGRFFTITQEIWNDRDTINTLPANEIEAILAPYMQLHEGKNVAVASSKCINKRELPDEEVLNKAFASKNGSAIMALYSGDMSKYGNDHSSADLALARHLAYWTNNDIEQMDRLFRGSELMRGKWDEMHGSSTYGEMTLVKAIESNIDYEEDKDAPSSPCNPSPFVSSADYVLSGAFKSHIDEFKSLAERKTGFSNMDEKNSIYPGVYCIGAISSLGKTTFMAQMADQMAATGVNVLFFSFEQTSFELVSKGLARYNAHSLDGDAKLRRAPSAIDIRSGKVTVSDEVIEQYTSNTGLYIIDCSFGKTVDDIIKDTKKFMELNPEAEPPVIIVDYLQVIAQEGNLSVKEHIHMVVKKLKQLQKELNITVFIISSFNRTNYMNEVSFESFKESGDIEYTCDAMWGMQLACIDENSVFTRDNSINEKRKVLNTEKSSIPRRIELVFLKTRYNRVGSKFFFNYYPNCDFFIPSEMKTA